MMQRSPPATTPYGCPPTANIGRLARRTGLCMGLAGDLQTSCPAFSLHLGLEVGLLTSAGKGDSLLWSAPEMESGTKYSSLWWLLWLWAATEDSGDPSMVTPRTHRPLKPSFQQAQLSHLGLDQLFSGNPQLPGYGRNLALVAMVWDILHKRSNDLARAWRPHLLM